MPDNKIFLTKSNLLVPKKFNIRLTASTKNKVKPDLLDSNGVPYPVTIYYSQEILKQFQDIISESSLCGEAFFNPYTEKTEFFPNKPQEFTARHLQILARNERLNVNGIMNFKLYGGLLTEDQISRIRCLVKETVVVGKVLATHIGGYNSTQLPIPNSEQVIVIDQSGYQWQGDLHNTGGIFFYSDESESARLPAGYKLWQKEMHIQMLGKRRPEFSSKNHLELEWFAHWNTKVALKGKLDLDGFQQGMMFEFHEALFSLMHYSKTHPDTQPINFKFLKAGMGFFCDGLHDPKIKKSIFDIKGEGLAQLELARLKGIQAALETYPNTLDFGKIKRLTLPFSADCPSNATVTTKIEFNIVLKKIEEQCQRLNLEWGGAESLDVFTPTPEYTNAFTNCGDPHALIGNEGGFDSVDAEISSNIPNIQLLNAAYNPHMTEQVLPRSNFKKEYSKPVSETLDFVASTETLETTATPALKELKKQDKMQLAEPERDFLKHLKEIKTKEKDLRDREFIVAANKAKALYRTVKDNYKDLKANKIDSEKFKVNSLKAIEAAREELEKHREGGWKQLLGNLALAVIGVGILYLIAIAVNKATTGRYLFFKTESAEKLDNLQKDIKNSCFSCQ